MDIFSIVNCREPIGNTSLGRARSNGPQKLWHRKPVAGSPAHPTKVVAQARKPVAGSPAHPTKVVAI
ncbi:MAG: hypothetical protein EAZ25_27335 [Oscillatoriales cyanobacterium]|nr:MAG: hypothetical protein EAZ25_27335 [Oscillatoriales cyanobacterium]